MPFRVQFSSVRSWLLLSAMALSTTRVVQAQDPPPWNDLLKSELVVVGQYRSHKNGSLSLRAVDVLRGKNCKAGDDISVKLAPQIGFKFNVLENVMGNRQFVERFLSANDTEHSPKMFFVDEVGKQVQETLITYNAQTPHVYFFAKEGQAVLDRPNQVQPDRRRGWKRMLDGKPADLSFPILFAPHSDMSRKAIAELFKTRDREAIDGLVEVLLERERAHPRSYQTQEVAARVLRSLGDKDGDVYDAVRKAITPGMDTIQASKLIWLLPQLDSKRALGDLKEMLKREARVSRQAVSGALVGLESEEGLDLMFECMQEGDYYAFGALQGLMFNRHGYGRGANMVQRARLQELALPRLQKMLKDRVLSQEIYSVAMFYENFRFHVEEPPLNYQGWRNGTGFDNANRCPRRDGFPEWQRLEYESQGDLEPILKADLIEGRKRLKDRFANAKPGTDGPFDLLVLHYLAERYGDAEIVKNFKRPAEPVVRFMEGGAARFHRLPFSQFMKEFEKTPKPSQDYWPRMAALFPAHADVYFREIETLLVSEDKPKRDFAIYQLKDRFFWDFDLDADDYPFVNKRKVEALRPLFGRLSQSKDILEMRGMVLQHFGVKLDGPAGRGWLPTLEGAVMRWNSVIHLNTLCMLGMIEEDPEVMRFANYPLSMRQKELEGHLKQRRAKKNVPAWTPEQFQPLWKDLDSDRATSYAAMQSLLRSDSTVAWLSKRLKQPGRDPVRDVRAIQVLEYMPGREARALLEELAAGGAGTPLTHEARGAMQRLARFWRW